MFYRSRRSRAALAAALTTALLGLAPSVITGSAQAVNSDTTFTPKLVKVDTPTRADKRQLQTLGLDLTEHAGHDYVEVVLHKASDAEALRESGLTFDVRIGNLLEREARNNQANAAFAAATSESRLPSGRDSYRTLADYNNDMRDLATSRPNIAKQFDLPHPSLDGKKVQGIEIGADVKAPEDGRPVFLLMGVHHAREWPSGELAMEFAHDLVKNYGQNARITGLLDKSRVLIVPVVNVDGFDLSRTDGGLVDLRESDNGGHRIDPRHSGERLQAEELPERRSGSTHPTAPAVASRPPVRLRFGIGVDPNRNYGGFWGGPGASATFADPTYRGAGPFSEPETQNIRELISSRQITTMISNHTFSNLVLRPNGVHPDTIGPDGNPVGNAPDEEGLKALGAKMTAANGFRNIHGWELYDTTGTTEDWSYNATGGYGYTFEIGPNEFHPPFPQVIDEYLGAGEYAGKGNREAYLVALENTVDTATHSVIRGDAPKGATLRLRKEFATPTWESSFQDKLETTMQVGTTRQVHLAHQPVHPTGRPGEAGGDHRGPARPLADL